MHNWTRTHASTHTPNLESVSGRRHAQDAVVRRHPQLAACSGIGGAGRPRLPPAGARGWKLSGCVLRGAAAGGATAVGRQLAVCVPQLRGWVALQPASPPPPPPSCSPPPPASPRGSASRTPCRRARGASLTSARSCSGGEHRRYWATGRWAQQQQCLQGVVCPERSSVRCATPPPLPPPPADNKSVCRVAAPQATLLGRRQGATEQASRRCRALARKAPAGGPSWPWEGW